MQAFLELASIDGIDGLLTLSSDNVCTLCSRLSMETNCVSWHNIADIECLQCVLKLHLEKGYCEIGANFDYSSIDEDYFRNFTHNPFNYLRDGKDHRPIFTSSPSRKLLDYLESIGV